MRCKSGGGSRWTVMAPVAALMLWGAGCGQEGGTPPVADSEAPSEPGPTLAVPAPQPPAPQESQTPEPLPSEPAPGPSTPPERPPERTMPPAPHPWSHQRGGPQDDTGMAVAVDGAGHVSWVWLSTPREDADRPPVDGQQRALTLSRYTVAGGPEWTREFQRNQISEPHIGASGDGAVYLGGNAFLFPVDFGLGDAEDGFLVRFSSAGEPEWQRRVGQKIHGLSVGASGEVLISGEEWTAEAHVPLLTRYAADGSVRWTRRLVWAGEGTELGAVALTPTGRAVATGALDGELELSDQRFGAAGAPSLAVFMFEPDGSLAWGRVLSGVEGRITGVAVRADGSVVVAGEAQGALRWGGTTLPEGGAFLLTMDSQGHEGWLRRPGCDALGFVPSLAVGASSEVVAACGSTLSFYAPDGASRGERTLQPESCESGACTLTSTAVGSVAGGALVVTGHQRDGVTTDHWNQDAFLRFVVP
ncbi:MAG: hypothetical protein ACJ8AT_26275 [Hyalangium sp.]|uniref:hypothetical protein n=1 Tax=Hyalangium sp. TaxID=2028555 RepID=UPI00389AC8D7